MTIKEANNKYIHNEEVEFLGKPLGDMFIEPEEQISGYKNMEIELLSPISEDAYKDWINSAMYASLSTWDMTPENPVSEMRSLSLEEKEEKLLYMLSKRPISVALEGAVFTFRCINIPRALTHQIVRHRQMSFGQQSFRVNSCYSDAVRTPQSLLDMEDGTKKDILLSDFENGVKHCREIYKNLIENGVPMEQARQIMPMGTCTKIAVTMKLRDMISYVQARTGAIAQDEHTYFVCLMMKELKEKQPLFFKFVNSKVPTLEAMMEKYLNSEKK